MASSEGSGRPAPLVPGLAVTHRDDADVVAVGLRRTSSCSRSTDNWPPEAYGASISVSPRARLGVHDEIRENAAVARSSGNA